MRIYIRFLLSLIFLFPLGSSFAQTTDIAAARQEIDSLIELNENLVKERKFEEAFKVIRKAEVQSLAVFGRESSQYAECMSQRGNIYYAQDNFSEVEPFWLEAKGLFEKVTGKETSGYVILLNNLGTLYRTLGKYEQAEQCFLETKAIQEKRLGKEHPDYASSLDYLARVYQELGKYDEAETLFLKAKTITKKALGKENLQYASSLNDLGLLYEKMGRYEHATQIFEESNAILAKVLGKDDLEYGTSLNNLGLLYQKMGEPDKAEMLIMRSLKIRQNALGTENATSALIASNLGILYYTMGEYDRAEKILEEAKNVFKRVYGEDHPTYALGLNNLAKVYEMQEKHDEAEALLLKSNDIYASTYGEEHPNFAFSLNNLADLYLRKGDYLKAEELFLQARAIREKALGKEHSEYAQSLNNLARVYIKTGKFSQAELLLQEARAIYEKTYGTDYAGYGIINMNLADLFIRQANYGRVEPLLVAQYQNLANQLNTGFSFLSENEKEKFLKSKIEPGINRIQSAAINIHSPTLQGLQYDLALISKGVRLEARKSTLEYILQQQDSLALSTYQQLVAVRRLLARQYELPLDQRNGLDKLELQEEGLEKKLARLSAAFRQEEAASAVTSAEVKAALKEGEAAVEFVHFNYYHPELTDSVLYAAAVLLPQAPHARFIPLFEQKQLDALLGGAGDRRLDYVDRLYTFADRGVQLLNKKEESRPSLYELIWRPIDSLLQGITTVYYSPSGLLHRLNLGAIAVDAETTLASKYQLHALSSTRRLALPLPELTTEKTALVFGGVRYDYDSIRIEAAIRGLDPEAKGEVEPPSSLGAWKYLKWTEKEGEAIYQLLAKNGYDVSFQDGFLATEDSFRSLGMKIAAPRVLHLATHGFFFPDPGAEGDRQIEGENIEPAFKVAENPMIRSGLILAGANRAWQDTTHIEGQEDGILTAYEISQLNLTNTELVVLSACETGLGDIQGSEGVFGLQRAFKIAGAHYLIMSLWQVPDFQTQDLMVTFYTYWLEQNMTIPEAFRTAQMEMREKYQNPYFWAGFVLLE